MDHPGIHVLPPSSHVSLQIGQKEIQVKFSTVKAIDNAPKLGFTSLDNLHLAITSLAAVSKDRISYFITGDAELLNHATLIEKHLQFTTVNPGQILKKLEASP